MTRNDSSIFLAGLFCLWGPLPLLVAAGIPEDRVQEVERLSAEGREQLVDELPGHRIDRSTWRIEYERVNEAMDSSEFDLSQDTVIVN